MLQEFVTCGDCECQSCLKNHSCPKTECLENPCIECDGTPPYAPWNTESLHLHKCNDKKPSYC